MSVVTLSNSDHSTVVVTATTVVEGPSASAQSNNISKGSDGNKSNNSLSKGAIAGIVIGSIIGSFLLAAAIFFFLWRRRQQNSDLEETKHHQPYSFGDGGAMVLPVAAQRNNSLRNSSSSNDAQITDEYLQPSPVFGDNYGRIRLSNGSLPDLAQEHGPLRIVNPDSD